MLPIKCKHLFLGQDHRLAFDNFDKVRVNIFDVALFEYNGMQVGIRPEQRLILHFQVLSIIGFLRLLQYQLRTLCVLIFQHISGSFGFGHFFVCVPE